MGVVGTSFGVTWTEVVNWALARLATGSISSIADGSRLGNVASTTLGQAIGNVASAYPWRCLTTRVELARDATTPVNDYAYSYTLPSDFLDFARGRDGDPEVECTDSPYPQYILDKPQPLRTEYNYSVESNALLTNGEIVKIAYIAMPGNDPSSLPYTFKQAVAAELAYLTVMALTSAPQLLADVEKQAQIALRRAIIQDGMKGQDFDDASERGYDWYDDARYWSTWGYGGTGW